MRFARACGLAYVAFALIVVVFFSSFMWFRGMRADVLACGPILLALALAAGVALLAFARRTRTARAFETLDRHFALVSWGLALVVFAAQMVIVHEAWFTTDWDAGFLVWGAVEGIDVNPYYFSLYPNQTFLLSVFTAIAQLVPGDFFDPVYYALVVGGCLCLSASTAMIGMVARKLGGVRVAVLALALCTLLVGFSPWMFVPYSDSYGMLCPTLALFLFVHVRRRPVRLGAIAAVSVIGYYIKPTSIFVLAAVVVVEAFSLLKERHGAEGLSRVLRQGALSLAALAVGVALSFGVNALMTAPYELDDDVALSMEHYLMMGANYESTGRYTEDDLAFSTSIADPAERKAANVEKWKERVSEMGPVGVAKLFVKKTLNNYLDGSFWWEGEGSFYRDVKGDNQAIKDFYNIGHEKNWIAGSSQNATPYFHMAQFVWLFVLSGCALGLLRSRSTNGEAVAVASLLAVSAFLGVFECRARYLFLYAPYFMLVAALGWQGALRFVEARLPRRSAVARRSVHVRTATHGSNRRLSS